MAVPQSPQHREAVALLQTAAVSKDRIAALRFIKNAIIGNPSRKQIYVHDLNLAPTLVTCLQRSPESLADVAEISAIIGSLAMGNEAAITALVEGGVLAPLFSILNSQDARLVEAAARALRSIFSHQCHINLLDLQSVHISNLVCLSSVPSSGTEDCESAFRIAEIALCVLAKVAERLENRAYDLGSRTMVTLAEWVRSDYDQYENIQVAALDALASICKDNMEFSKTFVGYTSASGERVVEILFGMMKNKPQEIRLGAATWYNTLNSSLSYMYKCNTLPFSEIQRVSTMLLPTVIRLFADSHSISLKPVFTQKSILLFAYLISDSKDLQAISMEGDAVSKLAIIIKSIVRKDSTLNPEFPIVKSKRTRPFHIDEMFTSALLGVAAISSLSEATRKQVIANNLLPIIVHGLKVANSDIRTAACKCARSLSRSVKNLRTSLMDGGIAQPLFELLFDENQQVQIIASATLCNIILDFSPMKQIVIDKGGVQRLIELTRSMNSDLRLNAVWALKNMLFQADLDTKKIVMADLKWRVLFELIDDVDLAIQEQSLCLLRNVACGGVNDINLVFAGIGSSTLLSTLASKICNMDTRELILVQAIYIVVNIAIGSHEHKNAVMMHAGLMESIVVHMYHENALVRAATIWCIINLSWVEDEDTDAMQIDQEEKRAGRVDAIKQYDVVPRLKYLCENDIDVDVRDRSKTALANLE